MSITWSAVMWRGDSLFICTCKLGPTGRTIMQQNEKLEFFLSHLIIFHLSRVKITNNSKCTYLLLNNAVMSLLSMEFLDLLITTVCAAATTASQMLFKEVYCLFNVNFVSKKDESVVLFCEIIFCTWKIHFMSNLNLTAKIIFLILEEIHLILS